MTALPDTTVLHKPDLHCFEREGIYFFVDPEAPNWIATDDRGAKLLEGVDGRRSLGEIRSLYTALYGVDWGKGWRETHFFFQEAIRKGMVATTPVTNFPYTGRFDFLKPVLREFWIHLLQTCNLSCTHCLVSSNPQGDKGQETSFYMRMIDEAADLGVRRFYFTGGEPFLRSDIFDLITQITENKKAELIILTNATLFEGERLRKIQSLNRERLRFQVSLDGTSAKINDPIRGKGVFQKTSRGLRTLSDLGFETTLTAVVTRENLNDLTNLPALAKALGAGSVHLLWPFQRGEILKMDKAIPSVTELLSLARKIKTAADPAGILFDNATSLKQRVNGRPGVKNDLGNLCWESLCLYSDGQIYPSAALAGIPELALGDARQHPLRLVWLESPMALEFRKATLADNPVIMKNPFRFLTGGGDMEQSCCFSPKGDLSCDPYHDLSMELVKDAMVERAIKKRAEWNSKSGFNPPHIYHAMGDGAIKCSDDALDHLSNDNISASTIKFLHTNCVLLFDVERPYRMIQNFYGQAAVQPQKELCCPVKYDDTEVGHIPQEVLDRFYGCGSPVAIAGVRVSETVLDLGSGAGIDCFIAAKKVGPQGRVIGVDMTDPMLEVANKSKQAVAANLGFDVVEFKKGYLEKIPVENKSVDLVTSNCVINLSPDKSAVFAEIWRVLKNNGRMVVADIVSATPVPLSLQAHPDLWGECISGALSEEEFMAGLEKAGFYGISLLKKTFWKEVEGYPFYSITLRGFKFEKREGCQFIGHRAIYRGPFTFVMDEEGHLFPRGEEVEICTDTAARLSAPPYDGCFVVVPTDTLNEQRPQSVYRPLGAVEIVASSMFPPLDRGCIPSDEGKSCC